MNNNHDVDYSHMHACDNLQRKSIILWKISCHNQLTNKRSVFKLYAFMV